MQNTAAYWIKKLDLTPLPEEGGLYKENYRSDMTFKQESLPNTYAGDRTAITDIYYLLQGDMFSAFHKLKSDEIWHYHAGSALRVHCINPSGNYHVETLGTNLEDDEKLRVTLPRGVWFAAELQNKAKENYALVSCVVAPGFEFADFELGNRATLTELYPDYAEIIHKLTRNQPVFLS